MTLVDFSNKIKQDFKNAEISFANNGKLLVVNGRDTMIHFGKEIEEHSKEELDAIYAEIKNEVIRIAGEARAEVKVVETKAKKAAAKEVEKVEEKVVETLDKVERI